MMNPVLSEIPGRAPQTDSVTSVAVMTSLPSSLHLAPLSEHERHDCLVAAQEPGLARDAAQVVQANGSGDPRAVDRQWHVDLD